MPCSTVMARQSSCQLRLKYHPELDGTQSKMKGAFQKVCSSSRRVSPESAPEGPCGSV